MELSRKPTLCAAALAAALFVPGFCALAQDEAPPSPPPAPASTPSVAATPAPANPGEQFRQRINDRLKTALKASDDEWSVIQPLLEKVEDKQRQVLTNRFGGLMGRGGPGGENRRRPENAGAPQGQQAGGDANRPRREARPQASAEATALETALQDDNTNVNDIKTRLAALRAEREKANADLASARSDLQKVLNMRQEAVLVLSGILE
jgi:hypothetical protein